MLNMLRAFFDESSDNKKLFIVAGWLGRFDEWERVADAWQAELDKHPAIKYFNHNEAMGLKDQFASWSVEGRDDKLLSLAKTIARYELTGFVGTVSIPQFKVIFGGKFMPRKVMRNLMTFNEPYHFCCNGAVTQTLYYQLEIGNRTDQVDFIFDEGAPYLEDCIRNYPEMKKRMPSELRAIAGTMIPGNDKKIVALQAADFLASQTLLGFRLNQMPIPLGTIVSAHKKIAMFNCAHDIPGIIPQAIKLLDVAWGIRQAAKSMHRGKQKRGDKK